VLNVAEALLNMTYRFVLVMTTDGKSLMRRDDFAL
jgi:hypothetical protein